MELDGLERYENHIAEISISIVEFLVGTTISVLNLKIEHSRSFFAILIDSILCDFRHDAICCLFLLKSTENRYFRNNNVQNFYFSFWGKDGLVLQICEVYSSFNLFNIDSLPCLRNRCIKCVCVGKDTYS